MCVSSLCHSIQAFTTYSCGKVRRRRKRRTRTRRTREVSGKKNKRKIERNKFSKKVKEAIQMGRERRTNVEVKRRKRDA